LIDGTSNCRKQHIIGFLYYECVIGSLVEYVQFHDLLEHIRQRSRDDFASPETAFSLYLKSVMRSLVECVQVHDFLECIQQESIVESSRLDTILCFIGHLDDLSPVLPPD
jgi:hypothetical protein